MKEPPLHRLVSFSVRHSWIVILIAVEGRNLFDLQALQVFDAVIRELESDETVILGTVVSIMVPPLVLTLGSAYSIHILNQSLFFFPAILSLLPTPRPAERDRVLKGMAARFKAVGH